MAESINNLPDVDKQSIYIDRKNKTIDFVWKHGQVNIDHKSGKISVDRNKEFSVNEIKRNYSRQVIKTVAKKYGWLVKGKSIKQGTEQLKFVIQKK